MTMTMTTTTTPNDPKMCEKKRRNNYEKKVNGKNVYHRFILLDDFKMMA